MKRLLDGTIERDDTKRPRLDSVHASQHDNPQPSNDTLCSDCQQIDFDNVLKHRKKRKNRFRIANLSHIHRGYQCHLCAFFRAVSPSDTKTADKLSLVGAFGEAEFGLPSQATASIDDEHNDQATTACLLLAVAKTLQKAPETYFMNLRRNMSPFKPSVIKPLVDFDYLRTINKFCIDHHRGNCQRDVIVGLHTFRVIDCATRKLVTVDGAKVPFVTLSYLWGEAGLQEEQENEDLPPEVPATIRDAILVTLKLGYRYLWVDRYCIRQRHSAEKTALIQSMGRIYSASTLTIVAACGTGSSCGLPGISGPRVPQPSITVDDHNLVSIVNAKKDILSSQWNTRGWTYQEGLLARRRLIFTDAQVYFQCAGMHCLESFAIPLEILHGKSTKAFRSSTNIHRVYPFFDGAGCSPRAKDLDKLVTCYTRINEYNERNFTYEGDRIAAFQGILAAISATARAAVHLNGLLLLGFDAADELDPGQIARQVMAALLWGSCATLIRRSGFPSWTWVGWKRVGTGITGLSSSPWFTGQFRLSASEMLKHAPVASLKIVSQSSCGSEPTITASDDHSGLVRYLRDLPPPTQLILSGWTFELLVMWTHLERETVSKQRSWDLFTQKRNAITCVLGSPSDFDIRRSEKTMRGDERLLVIVLSAGVTSAECLVLEHKDGERYERAGILQFGKWSTEHGIGRCFTEDFSEALDPAITWRQITLV